MRYTEIPYKLSFLIKWWKMFGVFFFWTCVLNFDEKNRGLKMVEGNPGFPLTNFDFLGEI